MKTEKDNKRILRLKGSGELNGVKVTAIVDAANECDGHNLLGVTTFTSVGLPEAFVMKQVRTHKSDMTDDTGKGIIFGNDGKALKELTAIKGLDMLRAICLTLGLDWNGGYFGRGRIAASMSNSIQKWAAEKMRHDEAVA